MKNIKLNLGRPYSREAEAALTINLEFTCEFTAPTDALVFNAALIQLIRDFQSNTNTTFEAGKPNGQ